jgi:hypothetical protein
MRGKGLMGLLTPVLAVAVLAGACVDDSVGTSLVIVGNKALGANCQAEASDSGLFQSRGVLDLVLPLGQYTMHPILRNQMPPSTLANRRQVQDLRVDTNDVALEKAQIRYSFPNPTIAPDNPKFVEEGITVFISGTVSSGGGLTAVALPVLDFELAQALDAKVEPRSADNPSPRFTMLAKVQISGRTLDGAPLVSSEFTFPLDICRGCLLTFPSVAAVPGAGPNCRGVTPFVGEHPCLVGQDKRIDCRICRENKPIAERGECEPL